MVGPREEALVVHLFLGKSRDIQSHPVRVECRPAIRCQDHDGLANGIGDRAKVRLILTELPLGARYVINVGIDPTPADNVGLLIVDRRRRDLKPAILTVEAAQAHFRLPRLLGLLEILPPGFELLDIVPMDSRFPFRSIQLVRRKSGVVPKSLVEEIQGVIR